MASDERTTPRSANTPFDQVFTARLSRRGLLAGGVATAAATFLAGGSGSALFAAEAAAVHDHAGELLGFAPIGPSQADRIVVPEGYVAQVLVPWGTPLQPDGPAWKADGTNTAEEQAQQVGSNHDGMHYFPFSDAPDEHGLLVLNNEYYDPNLFFPDGNENWSAEKTLKGQNAVGVTVVEIARVDGAWQRVDSRYNRRVTANTPMVFTGPAAGHALLRTALDPTGTEVLGTFANCANGWTPWATYLTCEENFNGYFENRGEGEVGAAALALFESYGVSEEGTGARWADTDERFRADLHPNEPNHFGWVVEVNPWVPGSVPAKRTALGRLKHEGAMPTVNAEDRVVVYMGDDERFEYVYKFVSSGPWREMLDAGTSPLDEGTLYVARFDEDGTGTWLPVVWGQGPLTAANGFADQGEVLVRTRDAADLLGATPMDRPEWGAVAPWKEVFMTFTNNTAREEVDAANPRPENAFGHILRWTEEGRDAAATSFSWDVFLLAGAGEGSGDGSTVPADAAFGSPDGLWVDARGGLWIETDGSQPIDCNNQVLVADPWTGAIGRFLVGPAGCEVTGITSTPDQTTLFVNIQHPGESAESPANPTEQSSWPDGDPSGRPRSSTVAIWKAAGGAVGS